MPVPKKKMSHARKMRRRAQHDKMDAPSLSTCPRCNSYKLPHRVCGSCGYYKNRTVIEVGELEDFE